MNNAKSYKANGISPRTLFVFFFFPPTMVFKSERFVFLDPFHQRLRATMFVCVATSKRPISSVTTYFHQSKNILCFYTFHESQWRVSKCSIVLARSLARLTTEQKRRMGSLSLLTWLTKQTKKQCIKSNKEIKLKYYYCL